MELAEPVPGARGLERLDDHAAPDEAVARVGRPHERVAPRADRALPAGATLARLGASVGDLDAVGDRPAVVAAQLGGALDPRVDRVIGGLEAEHEKRRRRSSVPADSAASPPSSRRQFVGNSADWLIARVAATPSS